MSHPFHWYAHIWDQQMLGGSSIQSFSFFSLLDISFVWIYTPFPEPLVWLHIILNTVAENLHSNLRKPLIDLQTNKLE